eukprot:8484-Heterococcus_DN1.PRE.3
MQLLALHYNSATDDMQVQLSVLGAMMVRIEQHMQAGPTDSDSTTWYASRSRCNSGNQITTSFTNAARNMSFESSLAAAATAAAAAPQRRRRKQQQQQYGTASRRQSAASEQYESDANCSGTDTSCCDTAVRSVSSSDSSTLGYGAALYSAGYAELAGVLERLQLPPTAVTVMHDCAVGQGNFAVVYKAVLGNKVCAAKVVKVEGLKPLQFQKLLTKFTKELYILSKLRHRHIVSMMGCTTTYSELTIVLEYMQRGSLRSVLDSADHWQQYSPELRHQILCDIAEDDRRAVLTDFGLSKTATSISGMTNTESSFRGATPAWTAPEVFGTSKKSPQFIAKSDVYSYGILIYEVLSGAYPVAVHGSDGSEVSNLPWYGMSCTDVFAAVVAQGRRPQLHSASVHDGNVLHAVAVVDTMAQCVSAEPFDRPTFERVLDMLQEHEQLWM